jgi:zinc protease
VHALQQRQLAPAAVADECLLHVLYGDHPYGHTSAGLEAAVAGVSIDDVRAQYTRAIRPEATTMIVVGDCHHDAIVDAARTAFSDWASSAPPPRALPPVPQPACRLAVLPWPGARQSEVRVGTIAAPRSTSSYTALQIGNMVLGGQFTSRINGHLRQTKGLTYGAYSSFDYRREAGPFVVRSAVRGDGGAVAVAAIVEEVSAIVGSHPIEPDEFASAVSAVTRGYARDFESVEQLARAVVHIALYDLPADEFSEFVPRAQGLTSEEVGRQLARFLDPSRMVAIVVGDLEAFAGSLASLGLGEPFILTREHTAAAGAAAAAVASQA